MLAQITKDNFFYERTRTNKRCGQTQITTYKVQDVKTQETFFSMKEQGQKLGVGRHKSKQTEITKKSNSETINLQTEK